VSDVGDDRRAMPPPVAARPKGAPLPQRDPTMDAEAEAIIRAQAAEKRGPGRPPKADPFTVLRVVAVELKSLDKDARRQVLETLLALSE
jgi:hypothetical protein